MAEQFALNRILRPAEFDSSIDYLVNLVREGMDVENIRKMLSKNTKENNNDESQ
ncbi:hypothetical protein [Thomasclavelia cocleata]|uniref:hypothetical protein n=1 Tax=Thomasclavelia cocleata TaxID=69824 RepID=UPI002570E290|nr:hypothetical protein [Thomasclavelia cocleata]